MDAQEPAELVKAAAGDAPDKGLEAVRRLRGLVDDWEEQQVSRARQQGWSWAEIAARLGRHRQAVHREYAAGKGASRRAPAGADQAGGEARH